MQKHLIPLDVRPNGEVFFEGKKISSRRSANGYQHITISIHRLVAHVFHGPPGNPKFVCHHKDGNPRNNRADNLCWISQAENTRLHFAGRPKKLTERQIDEIRSQNPGPMVRLNDLAAAFNVSYSTVCAVRSGRNWKNESGKKSNRAILTDSQIKAIRDWAPPIVTAASLARKYHVSGAYILNIWHGRT